MMKTKLFLPMALALGSSASLQAAALVYESFSQTAGNLNGLAGETGLNNWVATSGSTSVVTPATLSYGDLQNAGGQAALTTSGNTSISVTTSTVLATNNLLDDDGELWFSMMISKASSGGSNEKGAFAFGTGALSGAFNGERMSGYGVGFRLVGNSANVGTWNGTTGVGNVNGSYGSGLSLGTLPATILIVGKIEWGATAGDDEMITLYNPSTIDLGTLGTGVSRTVSGFDQTAINTISMTQRSSGGDIIYDEIRFGASQVDVLPTVPEPATTALLGLGGLALIIRRRK